MNKVKYPDKKVIQQQICTIIDRSGMFDEQQDSQMFTEIKPVAGNIHIPEQLSK